MRSKKSHPVAVLRMILDLRQKEFATLIGVSTVLVQKIETRQRSLTADIAKRIEEQTGAHEDWLLAGTPKAAPMNRRGAPYQKHDYENAQAKIRNSANDGTRSTIDFSAEGGERAILAWSIKEMLDLHLGGALRKGSYAFNMLCFRLEEFLRNQSRALKLETGEEHEALISERRAEIERDRQRPRWSGNNLKGSGVTFRFSSVPGNDSAAKARQPRRKKK